jgi:outer membrane phospholipase A
MAIRRKGSLFERSWNKIINEILITESVVEINTKYWKKICKMSNMD